MPMRGRCGWALRRTRRIRCLRRLFRELKRLAAKYGAPFSCHVAEFDEEVRFLQQGGGELEDFLRERDVFDADWRPPGKTPLAYLDGLGVLESMAAVHLNAAHEDLGLLAARGACAVFCPGSTRWFGRTRFMPVRDVIDSGVCVALGTDCARQQRVVELFARAQNC